LKTEVGSELLVDGWWKYARKIHYTSDIVMALTWALSTGFTGVLPYFYPAFFLGMIMHRYNRDVHRCRRKYGKDWDRYIKEVPYAFIPFVI
jgi:delta24(24(1))-sterol reductase